MGAEAGIKACLVIVLEVVVVVVAEGEKGRDTSTKGKACDENRKVKVGLIPRFAVRTEPRRDAIT